MSLAPPPPPPAAPVDHAPTAAPPPPSTGRRAAPLWVTVLVSIVVAGLTTLGIAALLGDGNVSEPAATETGTTNLTSAGGDGELADVADVAAQVSSSVASVQVTVEGSGPGGASAARTGEGSAVILSDDGYLLTNNHVVDGAADVEVTLADGTRHTATVVGTDATSDLAVLDIDATDLPAATLADDLPEVGSAAVAIGSPFGLDGSVTSGIVSALDRTLTGGGATLTGLIQTDAAINPGNSGGALVDQNGRIIGINTAIYSASGANDGVGFAVPATTATAVADQLIDGGEVAWPVLGVTGQDLDARVADAYGLSTETGALIAEVVPGSGAADADLRAGDIIVTADGEPVTSMSDLTATIRSAEVDDTIPLTVVRDDADVEVEVTLGAG